MKQDQSEARHNVDKRLEWIAGEMCVLLRSGGGGAHSFRCGAFLS